MLSAPSQIGHEHYTYDANGNPTRVENDSTAAVREMYWEEDNCLMVLYRRHKGPVQERVSQGQNNISPTSIYHNESRWGLFVTL